MTQVPDYNHDHIHLRSIQKNIIVTTKFSAIHHWPGCYIEEVSYLKNPHRHEFHVQVKAPVIHDDRHIEFINLKNRIETWLQKNWDKKDLGQMSCEQMCTSLLNVFLELTYVRIMEDNENGAEVFYSTQSMPIPA